MKFFARLALAAAVVAGAAAPADAQIDARMFRYPDVSAAQIAFVYGGDIWTVPKAGGVATRLSSPAGEEMFPRFSPDGKTIAYSANYDGNLDVYVVPATGGDAGAAHAPPDGRPSRSTGIPTASACCSPRAARAGASATTSSTWCR